MACEYEELAMEEAKLQADETEARYWEALDAHLNALEEVQAAEAAQTECMEEHWILKYVGSCSDAVEAAEEARANYEDAVTEREQAYDDWREAMEEYNAAIDIYCDCLIMHPPTS